MNKTPDTLTVDAWAALLRSSRLMLEQVEQDLKKADLPPLVWYDVLWELRNHQRRGLRQSEISEQMLLTKHNLSRLLDRMEREGLVERLACDEDARGKRVHIKRAGVNMLKKMWPTYSSSIESNFGHKLSTSDKNALLKLLPKLG